MDTATKTTPTLLPIVKYGAPVLVTPAAPVKDLNDDLRRLIPAMFRTMYAEPGIGLAAPQVGVSLRLLVVDVAPDGQHQPMGLINPTIVEKKGKVDSEEGCLSFPGIQVTITRAEKVKVNAVNEKGLPVVINAKGLLSRCLQHEIDHIDGVTMIDHLPFPQKMKTLWEIRKRKKAGLW